MPELRPSPYSGLGSEGERLVQKSTGFLAARGSGPKEGGRFAKFHNQNRSSHPSFPWPLRSRTLSPSTDLAE